MEKAPYYRVTIEQPDGTVVEMNQFVNLTFSYGLNRGSTAQLTLSLKDSKLTELSSSPLYTWLRVYRWDDPEDHTTERLAWRGLLFEPSYTLSESLGTITLLYKDLAAVLAHRTVDRTYSVTTPTDASAILWDLINTTQSKLSGAVNVGDLGIVQGAAPTSKNRQPEKDLQNRPILDVLVSFSEYIDGIDWEITPTPINNSEGIFNTYFTSVGAQYHKGNVITTPLTYFINADNEQLYNNIKSLKVTEAGTDYANSILALGAQIEEVQYYSESADTTQQEAVGLFQDTITETNITEQTTLDDRADEELASRTNLPINIKLSMMPLQAPRFGVYDVGDIFTVRVKVYDFRDFTRQYRLYGITVNVDENGVEEIELDLGNI